MHSTSGKGCAVAKGPAIHYNRDYPLSGFGLVPEGQVRESTQYLEINHVSRFYCRDRDPIQREL